MEWQGSEVHFGAGHGDTHPYSRDSDSRKFPWVWGQPMGAKWNPAFKNYKTPAHGGRGRLISESLRSAWFAYHVPVYVVRPCQINFGHHQRRIPGSHSLWALIPSLSLLSDHLSPIFHLPTQILLTVQNCVTFHPCFLSYSSFQICLPIGKKDGRWVWGLNA